MQRIELKYCVVDMCQFVWCVSGRGQEDINTLFSNLVAIFQVLLRGGSTYRDMLKGEEARREDLDIDIEVKFNRI